MRRNPLASLERPIFGMTPLKPTTKTSLQSLPNELLLVIFSFLELKSYIISHGVCKNWQQLLPSTKLHPIRERLLNLYHSILGTPDFEQTQEWTSQHTQPFDREEYIRCLLEQHSGIPEEFRMWILEWPARLVIQATWPGLPLLECQIRAPVTRRLGVNWIAYRSSSPRLSSLVYSDPSQTFVPALLIWRHATYTFWLIFGDDDGPDHDLCGRVLRTRAEYHDAGSIPYYPKHTTIVGDSDDEESDAESVISDGERCLVTFNDWIHHLEFLWGQTIKELRSPGETYFGHDFPIAQPVLYQVDTPDIVSLPAPAWDPCQRTTSPYSGKNDGQELPSISRQSSE